MSYLSILPHGLTILRSQGSSRLRQYFWDAWVATRTHWRSTSIGCTTISRRKSTHTSYPLPLPTQPACRYCNRVFDPSSPKGSSIFLTLLQIYLQPGESSTAKSPASSTFPPPATLLQPALQLISRHSRRLDATETLKLLPPLVQARDVKEFLIESLRVPRFDTKVIREIAKARRDDVATRLMVLEERRVKIVDSRMCEIPLPFSFSHFRRPAFPPPSRVVSSRFLFRDAVCSFQFANFHSNRSCPQCHKRIGHNSVIAVHAPRWGFFLSLTRHPVLGQTTPFTETLGS